MKIYVALFPLIVFDNVHIKKTDKFFFLVFTNNETIPLANTATFTTLKLIPNKILLFMARINGLSETHFGSFRS